MALKNKNRKKLYRLSAYMGGKLLFVFAFIVVLFLVLAGRLTYLVVQRGDKYETIVLGQQNHTSSTIAYERGKIYDRNGNILATNEVSYTLVLEPKNIIEVGEDAKENEDDENEVLETTIEKLCEYFGFSEDNLRELIEENSNSYYVVYKEVPEDSEDGEAEVVYLSYDDVTAFQDFMEMADESITSDTSEEEEEMIRDARNIEGVLFEENYERVYPYGSLACRVLGFVSSGNVGNWGIEQAYNDTLNGTNGRSYYYFNQELEQEKTVYEAVDGNSVVSTIDMQIQQVIEEKIAAFDEEVGSSMTSVLVMNPQNGEILAMASSNPYDLNDYMNEENLLDLYSQEEIDEMKAYTEEKAQQEAEESTAEEGTTEEEELSEESTTEETDEDEEDEEDEQMTIYDAFYTLWKNPIISDTYEPGSTYKPFTVAAGLETGVLSGDEEYYCTGSLTVGNRNIGCSHVHGNITLKDAVAQSCNVSMMNIAFNEGTDLFYEYQELFGFGSKTGIDLPGEAYTASLVYTAETCENDATLATNAFGQNFNCTMIQMAAGFASLINGGYYYEPHVVKEIQDSDGGVVEEIEAEVLRETVSEETSEIIRSYLKETVESGTGTKAQIAGYSIGGKTGTAEKLPRNKEDYYISFMGFTPAEDPEVLIYVTIDEPNVENQASAALAVELEKECMEEIVEILGIEPTEEVTEETTESEE